MGRKAAASTRLPFRYGMSAEEAAISISVSVSFFLKMVAEGKMPRPYIVGSRRIWDAEEVQGYLRMLPREGGDNFDRSWDGFGDEHQTEIR